MPFVLQYNIFVVHKALILQLNVMLKFKCPDSVQNGFRPLNNVFFYVYRKG